MIGKVTEKDGKIVMTVDLKTEVRFYETVLEATPFLAVFPHLIGEAATDGTGLHNIWRGASGYEYQMTGEPPEVVFAKQVEVIEPVKPKEEIKKVVGKPEENDLQKSFDPDETIYPSDFVKPKPEAKQTTRRRRTKK